MRHLLIAWLVVGCTKPDPAEVVRPLESTLGAAVPAAYFAAVSMAALNGGVSPCATVVTPPGSGGAVHVDVGLGPTCPPMFGANEGGTMVVTGTWTPQLATFVMSFVGLTSEGRDMLVVGIGAMTVTPMNTNHLLISYAAEDIMVATGPAMGAGSKQIVYVVDVDTLGTDDPSDDTFSVSGGDQSLLAIGGAQPQADVAQVALGNAVFKSGCRRNPSSGLAAEQRAGTDDGGWLLFGFQSACDGNTNVVGAIAPYELLLGEKIPLGFLQ